MNDATQWRHALARKVAAGYAENPKVAAVALAGSVARGLADQHSDIELDVYWGEPPTDDDRVAPVRRAGGQIDIYWAAPPSDEEYKRIFDRTDGKISQLWPHEGDEWSEHYYVSGVSVGISGFLTTTVEQYLDDVLNRHDPDDERQMRLAAIHHAAPLHGEQLLQRWQERTAHFPHELSLALIKAQLDFDESWWSSEMWIARDAHLPLIQLLHHMQIKTLRILLALNRIYMPDPRFKWADYLIGRMTIRPENLAQRLKQVFALKPPEAVQAMDAIFYETLGLVRQHLPEVDVAFAERWHRHRRPVNVPPTRPQ